MKNTKQHIGVLQELLDEKFAMAENEKAAIKAGIAALKKDQLIEAMRLLVPLLGPVANTLLHR
jgi:hypothetical protein